jgi:hypothetical protein
LSGTDDLLAQLAGDEIDRLLAEADVERPAPASAASSASAAPAPAEPSPAVSPPVATNPPGDELDNLLSELNKEPAPASTGEGKEKTLTEQVPDVLAQLAVKAPVTLAEGAAASPAPEAATAESLENVMSAEEREALSLSNLQAATAAAEQEDASAAAAAAKAAEAAAAPAVTAPPEIAVPSGPVNPVVRVLQWINKPLSFIPDAARDPIGKAAIVTIVNSIAVLIYVVFIRH